MELGGPYRRPGRMFTSVRTDGFGTVYVSLGGADNSADAGERLPGRDARYRARLPGQWSDDSR